MGNVHLGSYPLAADMSALKGQSHIAAEQRVRAKCPSFAIVISTKDDEDVFHCHHKEQGPDNYRDRPDEILARRWRAERGRVDVERAGSNVAINDPDRLIGKPHKHFALEDLPWLSFDSTN